MDVNLVVLTGNVGKLLFGHTNSGSASCSFELFSERRDGTTTITTRSKINVYGPLVQICKDRVSQGSLVLVEGELMNRRGQMGDLTEVRARKVFVLKDGRDRDGEVSGNEGRDSEDGRVD